mmetsp:Transcript_127945/g.226684  ORF Transcript_127945/g.226684 Transcript_127945/m.226684 type:complete len:263 (-) Transcript_127945:76-864(-)
MQPDVESYGQPYQTAEVDATGVPLNQAHRTDLLSKNVPVEIRMGFVRKVYSILSAQLVLTVAIGSIFQVAEQDWLTSNVWMLFVAMIVQIAAMCTLACNPDLGRRFPQNYVLLFVYTIAYGIIVGFIAAMYVWQSVALAACITMGLFLVLSIYASIAETDFFGYMPYAIVFLAALLIFGNVILFMSLFGVEVEWLMVFYDVLAAMLFSFFIVFDTQVILGEVGKGHHAQLAIDDYAFGAITLYTDIMGLFLHLLRLLGERKN